MFIAIIRLKFISQIYDEFGKIKHLEKIIFQKVTFESAATSKRYGFIGYLKQNVYFCKTTSHQNEWKIECKKIIVWSAAR
ncbi:MAG: hypothetical protein ACK4TA_22615, partial [Saprospiraceae bacterium]